MRKSPELDPILKAWSGKIDQELNGKAPPVPRLPDEGSSCATHRRLLLFPALLAAAALLAVYLAGPRRSAPPEPSESATAQLENGFEALKPFFQELVRLFPHQTLWLSGEGTGLEMQGPGSAEGRQRIVLRVELQQEGPDGSWNPIWQRDVLTHEESWVDMQAQPASQESASFWVVGLETDTWLVETHLRIPGNPAGSVRKQLTLRRSSSLAADAQVEISPGVRMVQRLLPLDDSGESA